MHPALRRASILFASVSLAVAGLSASREVPRADTPFFFIQLSDPQIGFASGDAGFAQETANLEFAVAAVNRLHPAFVVVTGDLVNKAGDPAQIHEYLRIVGRIDRHIPLYNVPGNHDVGKLPTPASVAAYVAGFGPDHYAFRVGRFVGIVLDSCLFAEPRQVPEQASAQEAWLRAELEHVRGEGANHVVIFQHHPLSVVNSGEGESDFALPAEPRGRLLQLFRENEVRFVFAGHYHRNSLVYDGRLEMVTTGPVAAPLGDGRSGMRIVKVSDAGITHRYYDFGELPNKIE